MPPAAIAYINGSLIRHLVADVDIVLGLQADFTQVAALYLQRISLDDRDIITFKIYGVGSDRS